MPSQKNTSNRAVHPAMPMTYSTNVWADETMEEDNVEQNLIPVGIKDSDTEVPLDEGKSPEGCESRTPQMDYEVNLQCRHSDRYLLKWLCVYAHTHQFLKDMLNSKCVAVAGPNQCILDDVSAT